MLYVVNYISGIKIEDTILCVVISNKIMSFHKYIWSKKKKYIW